MSPLRWPPAAVARLARCTRCGGLIGTRHPVTAERWPGSLFCSAACAERMDAGFEAVCGIMNGRRTK